MTDPSILAAKVQRDRESVIKVIEDHASHVDEGLVDYLAGRKEAGLLHVESNAVDVSALAALAQLVSHLYATKASKSTSKKEVKA